MCKRGCRWWGLLAVLASATACASGNSESRALCATGLQQLVDGAASGGTVTAPACLYRETVTITKPLVLRASPGAEIRGSDVWTGWNTSGSRWVSTNQVPSFPTHGECDSAFGSRCLRAEQVFRNGTPLVQVTSNPGPGQFALDSSRRVILGDNPSGQLIEVTTRRNWIVGRADNVTVEGFRMRHAANDSQTGALTPAGRSGWVVRNNVLSDAHGAVFSFENGSNNQLVGNDIFRGGQLGIHGGGAGGSTGNQVRNNKIHDNNTEGFADGWEAGALKIAVSANVLVEGNEVYNNAGPGIWFDVNCRDVTIRGNRAHDNKGPGIFYEISSRAKITGNQAWENGWGFTGWGFGAGILVSSATDVEVDNNVVAWNGDGISVISQNRSGYTQIRNVWVHDNRIFKIDIDPEGSNQAFALAWLQDFAGGLFSGTSNNRGENNAYWYNQPEGSRNRFEWNGGYNRLTNFNGTPGEQNGRYLNNTEKDQILNSVGVPTTAKPR